MGTTFNLRCEFSESFGPCMNYIVLLFILAAHPFLKNKMVCPKMNQRSKLKNLKSFKDKHERKTYCCIFIAFNKTNCTVNENST